MTRPKTCAFLTLVLVAGWLAATAVSRAGDMPVRTVADIDALANGLGGRQVQFGRDLVTATTAHIGPNAADPSKRFAGNNLACTNCHLSAGARKVGVPLIGLFSEFPPYNTRTASDITLEERINACMTRSMNGRPLPPESPEMQALVSYVRFLSAGAAMDERLPGMGTERMPELTRAADPELGGPVYARACAGCHVGNGAGARRSNADADPGYTVPPLWGPDSFNDGAGMARISTLANFVHFNMPHGADHPSPQLSVEEAWDVAAYVLSQPRPHREEDIHDYPNLLQKPLDTPYGPYVDGYSMQQHRYGPFGPIRAEIERLKRLRTSTARR